MGTEYQKQWAEWLKAQHPKRDEPWHDHRYVASLDLLNGNTEHKRVLEFGGQSLFSLLMNAAWPESHIDVTGLDDVRTFKTEQRYDTVVIMEVIEHVHDVATTDIDRRARWTSSGQLAMLHNAVACLSPGGKLFVTTPNAVGYGVLWRTIVETPPRTYEPHVRELTANELNRLVAATGMKVELAGQWTVWRHHGLSPSEIERCKSILGQVRGAQVERGDILYHLSRKV